MKTFPIWAPKKSNFSKEILNSFEDHQQKLKEEIKKVGAHVKENAVISSPVNKNIVYKLETAFDIIITHEERHYEQAKEVYELLKTQKLEQH
jgi:hypothetical protein